MANNMSKYKILNIEHFKMKYFKNEVKTNKLFGMGIIGNYSIIFLSSLKQ